MLLKAVLLVWYSNTKIIFSLIMLNLVIKVDFKNWKYPIFDWRQSRCLKRYKKILWESWFGCKNLLNFICYTMKLHNCLTLVCISDLALFVNGFWNQGYLRTAHGHDDLGMTRRIQYLKLENFFLKNILPWMPLPS